MYKKIGILAMLILYALTATKAQENDSTAWHLGISTGTSVAAGFGRTEAVSWIAPRAEWHVNDRLTVSGGFALAGSLMPGGYNLHGLGPSSLAPRRQGTQVSAVWVKSEYRVNDRLWLWASMARVSGYAQPLWLDGSIPIEATAINGGMAWALSENSMLEMHFHFVHDHYANIFYPPYGHTYYGPFTPRYDIYTGHWPW